MKKLNLLLIVSIGLTIISCSSDDSTNSEDFKSLSKMKITLFKNSGEVERFATRVYEDNKPKTDSFYDISNELTTYFNWTYDNGKLSSQKGYLPDNTLTIETTILYDNVQRIKKTTRISKNNVTNTNDITTVNYTYNSDNTITSTSEFNNNFSTIIFSVNDLGLIYKEVSADGLSEVSYDNDNNVISLKTSSDITNYTYDNINLPPENFPVNENFIFGVNKNNHILYNNSLNTAANNEASITPKFHLKYEQGSNVNRTDWTLTAENYPLNKKFHIQNQLIINYDFIYN